MLPALQHSEHQESSFPTGFVLQKASTPLLSKSKPLMFSSLYPLSGSARVYSRKVLPHYHSTTFREKKNLSISSNYFPLILLRPETIQNGSQSIEEKLPDSSVPLPPPQDCPRFALSPLYRVSRRSIKTFFFFFLKQALCPGQGRTLGLNSQARDLGLELRSRAGHLPN